MAVNDYNRKKQLDVEADASFNQSFDFSGETSGGNGIAWNSDGTKMYLAAAETGSDTVYGYNLSSAFDTSTASFNQSFDISSNSSIAKDIIWNSDGTKMYIVDEGDTEILEYNLSTAYDISTASFNQSFDVSNDGLAPKGMVWNSDGTKMYVIDSNVDDINEYNLSTAFDISTASFNQSFDVSNEDTDPQGLDWNSNGTKMYVVGDSNDDVFKYGASSAYDISSLSFNDTVKDVSGQDTSVLGIEIADNDSKMYVVGTDNDNIYEYNLEYGVDKAQPVEISGGLIEQDGFEDGDFTSDPSWTEVAANGTATVQGTTVKNGSNALEISTSGSGEHSIQHDRGTSDTVEDGDTYTCWVRQDSSMSDVHYTVTDTSGDDLSDSAIRVDMLSSGSWRLVSGGGTYANTTDGSWSLGEWYRVEVKITPSNSEAEVKIYDSNGDLQTTLNGPTNGDSTLQYVFIRKEDDNANSAFFDDVSYSTTEVSENETGNGKIWLDWTNISDEQDIAVYDQDGNLLDYEIESLDTTAETAVLWAYNSWVRDGTTQAQVVYGDNGANTDRQNVTGTWDSENNIISSYNLSESSGNFLDRTSNNYDLDTITGTSRVSTGQFDGALDFDGSDDYASTGTGGTYENLNASSTQIIKAWIRPDTTPSGDFDQQPVTWGDDGNNDGWGVTFDSNQEITIFTVGDNTTGVSGKTSLDLDAWHQVVAVFNQGGDQIEVFVNGVSDYTYSTTDDSGRTDANLVVGTNTFQDTGGTFDGTIDEVAVYQLSSGTGQIDSAWIQADYDASPKAGQVFFSQQAAEDAQVIFGTTEATATGTGSTISIPTNPELDVQTKASSTSTGSTISLSGFSTLDTSTASATATGSTITIPTVPEVDIQSGASSTGTGSTVSMSGKSTLSVSSASSNGAGSTIRILTNPLIKIQTAASSSATGSTVGLDLAVTETLEVPGNATATGAGGTTNLQDTGVDIVSAASATASGSSIGLDLAVTETLEVPGNANTTGGGGTTNLQDTGVDIVSAAAASGTGGSNIGIDLAVTETLEVPGDATATAAGGTGLNVNLSELATNTATATATGSTISTNILGTTGEITVLIDGERIQNYTDIEVKKRLNEVDTFSFQAFIEDSSDRQLIQEGKEVKILENYNSLLFKGVLNEVEYKSSFRAKCEGNGMVQKLLNRKTNRDEYTNSAGDDIVKAEVPTSVISRGTFDSAPKVSVRFDHDNLARAVAGVANATGYDWYIDQESSDSFDKDYLNFEQDAGRDTVQETYSIGDKARLIEREKDDGFVANDITLLGRGDGINQLQANVFAATTKFTDTTQLIGETLSSSFNVDDATQLGSTGDNLLVRVGTEVMDVDITDSTTLSINSRGLNDYNGDSTDQIEHYEGVRVWLVENKTQGLGRFSPDNPESGSSIDTKGVREVRSTDKTITDDRTLEKVADLELKNRFEDVFRLQVKPTDPRTTQNLELGDKVSVKDVTAMDVDDDFDVVGMDVKRASGEEGTILHLANRPRRLTERLSNIESNTDTLNAHMQGATNFNGEHFEDNCDNSHPLTNKVFVPDDVVSINKFELTFARESFRGYVNSTQTSSQNVSNFNQVASSDSTGISLSAGDETTESDTVDSFDGNLTNIIVTVDSDGGTSDKIAVEITVTDAVSGGEITLVEETIQPDSQGGWEIEFLSSRIGSGDTIEMDVRNENSSNSLTVDPSIIVNAESKHSHTLNTEYGIFEPGSENDIDVEVKVDGNTVTTKNNISVGDEIITPIDLSKDLSEPLTGQYHDIKLVPKDIGGGEGGRCRLSADVTEKVFIESTL